MYISKKILHLIFTLCIILPINTSNFYAQLKIGTASPEGSYHNLGKSIQQILSKQNVNMDVIDTKGSVDNIHKLASNEIDLAIVQNDIAFFAENGLYPFEKSFKNFAGVITFYNEPVYLITNRPEVHTLEDIDNLKTNVGVIGSGLYTDAKIILKSSNLWNVVNKFNFDNISALNLLKTGELEVVFINYLTEDIKRLIKENKIFIVTLSQNFIASITKTYPYFTSYTSEILGHKYETISVKSIMITKSNLDSDIVYSIIKHIYNNFDSLTFPERNNDQFKDKVLLSMPLNSWHKGAEKYFQEINLIKSQWFLKLLWILLSTSIIIVVGLWLLSIYFFSFTNQDLKYISPNSKFLLFLKKFNLRIIQFRYGIVILIVITILMSDMLFVQYLEHLWALEHNVVSSFDNRSFIDNIIWMFVFGGSGYEDKLFPNSLLGKFFVTLIPIVGIGGFFTLVGMFTSDHIKRKILEAKGVRSKMVKNHIIICGWNENVPFMIQNLISDNLTHIKPLVLLADPTDELPLEKYDFLEDKIIFVRGNAENREDLQRANLKDADMAVIVADKNSLDPDAKNILKALTVEKYCRELENSGDRKNKENIYSIVEIHDPKNSQLAYDAYVDEIISLGHIKTKIFIRSIMNRGVSKFITEILTYNEFNEFYTVYIKNCKKLANKTFDQLLLLLRDHNILLLAINLENHKSREEIRAIKQKYNLNRSVISNPSSENEKNYKTQVDDSLIVLATSENVIDDAISKISNSSIL